MTTIQTIAEAVKDALNDAVFSQSFTAVRRYRPEYKLSDMDTLHVTVVPIGGVMSKVIARGLVQHDYSVDIGVQKRIDVSDESVIDGLVDLVGEIYDHFVGFSLFGTSGGDWIGGINDPIYVAEHLEQMSQFTSVLRETFRVVE